MKKRNIAGTIGSAFLSVSSCRYYTLTRDRSLLNATSDEKWKWKDRRTMREERIRDHMRTTIERDYPTLDAYTRENNLEEHVSYGKIRMTRTERWCVFFSCVWLEKENEMSGGICVLRAEMNLNRKSLRGPAANHSNIIRTRQRDCASPRHRFCISLTTVNIHNNLIYILLIYI